MDWRIQMNAALFEYTVRESRRARCIRLRVTPQRGLEIVLPSGCSRSRIAPALERKQQWIRSALERVVTWRGQFPPISAWQVPDRIVFPAIPRAWRVEMHPEQMKRVMARESGGEILRLRGNVGQPTACRAALHRWWLCQGRKYLVAMLQTVSRETGLDFNHATMRRQRTRWGSCSRRKSVSLNAKLLFLDPALVRYVMIHELCHTREMNHAESFWRLVENQCPDYRSLRQNMQQAWRAVPAWAD